MLTLLITRPLYESTTHYLYYWNTKVIDLAKKKSFKVLDLYMKKANKKTLASFINNKKPDIILLNGHGSSDFIEGQDEVIIKVGENEELLKDAIVYALSCKTGQVLGPKSIEIGTISYIGYKEDFNFWFNSDYFTRPLTDPRAKLFLEPSNKIGISLLKGHAVKEACERAKEAFLKNIQKLAVTNSPDRFVIPDLVWDMVHLDSFGDGNATVTS